MEKEKTWRITVIRQIAEVFYLQCFILYGSYASTYIATYLPVFINYILYYDAIVVVCNICDNIL